MSARRTTPWESSKTMPPGTDATQCPQDEGIVAFMGSCACTADDTDRPVESPAAKTKRSSPMRAPRLGIMELPPLLTFAAEPYARVWGKATESCSIRCGRWKHRRVVQ